MLSTRAARQLLAFLTVAILLATLLASLWVQFLRPQHPTGPTVRIATWNIKNLSDRSRLDIRSLAELVTSSGFDVLAIQEIKKQGEGVDKLLSVLGPPWRATSLSPMTGNSERFVFIYNGQRVQEIGNAHFIDSPEAALFDRTPYQASFRAGQFDFTLITVHLTYTDARRRRREAQALARIAREFVATSTEKDLIVLGDFNEEGRGNLHLFQNQGWELLNRDPTNLGSKQVLDNLIIEPKFTREWSGAAGAIRFDETRYGGNDKAARDNMSDHRPVYADFVTNLPDDD